MHSHKNWGFALVVGSTIRASSDIMVKLVKTTISATYLPRRITSILLLVRDGNVNM